ncbi:MAG: response regulator [Polyangiaceae bacterium]|nr:response regulator [Polyangiaceae bacterium]
MKLNGISVLLVDDVGDTSDSLRTTLTARGANVRSAGDSRSARRALEKWTPNVLLIDLALPNIDGFAVRKMLADDPRVGPVPAVAITTSRSAETTRRAIEAGFQKLLVKPFDLLALSTTLVTLAFNSARSSVPAGREIRASLAAGDVRAALRALNAATPYRFSSLLKLGNDGFLTSAWTFDRENPDTDALAPQRLDGAYCSYVCATRMPFIVADALTDPRTKAHPRRASVRSYCGVPVFASNGSFYGTLCHFDLHAQSIGVETVKELSAAAAVLSRSLTPALVGTLTRCAGCGSSAGGAERITIPLRP